MNDFKVRIIKIKFIFFLFVKIINYNKAVTEMSAAILKLIINYFKIFLIKSYINKNDIAFNKLRVNSDSFNIINKNYINSL